MYKVIKPFRDLQDDGREYKVGETYPKGDLKPTKKRTDELTKKHPKYGYSFVEEVKKKDKKE